MIWSINEPTFSLHKLAKPRRHAIRVHFAKIHFGWIQFGKTHFWKIHKIDSGGTHFGKIKNSITNNIMKKDNNEAIYLTEDFTRPWHTCCLSFLLHTWNFWFNFYPHRSALTKQRKLQQNQLYDKTASILKLKGKCWIVRLYHLRGDYLDQIWWILGKLPNSPRPPPPPPLYFRKSMLRFFRKVRQFATKFIHFRIFVKFSDFLYISWLDTWQSRHWLPCWQLRTTIWTSNLWTLNKEWQGQYSQFLQFLLNTSHHDPSANGQAVIFLTALLKVFVVCFYKINFGNSIGQLCLLSSHTEVLNTS